MPSTHRGCGSRDSTSQPVVWRGRLAFGGWLRKVWLLLGSTSQAHCAPSAHRSRCNLQRVDATSSALMLVQRIALVQLGPLDEDFFCIARIWTGAADRGTRLSRKLRRRSVSLDFKNADVEGQLLADGSPGARSARGFALRGNPNGEVRCRTACGASVMRRVLGAGRTVLFDPPVVAYRVSRSSIRDSQAMP